MNSSIQMDIDYTLKIDYRMASVKDLQYILQVLYCSSSMCIEDIIEMADEIIYRINEIGYDIICPKYGAFNTFIHSLYSVLKKLNIKKQRDIIHKNYNIFINKHIPEVSSPVSPVTISPPKIMKKPIKKTYIHS